LFTARVFAEQETIKEKARHSGNNVRDRDQFWFKTTEMHQRFGNLTITAENVVAGEEAFVSISLLKLLG